MPAYDVLYVRVQLDNYVGCITAGVRVRVSPVTDFYAFSIVFWDYGNSLIKIELLIILRILKYTQCILF